MVSARLQGIMMIAGAVLATAVRGVRLDSNRVKQIVTYKQQAAIGKMIVAAGAPIRPPTQRAPSC